MLRRFVYLILLMTAFNWMSHGTQDIYPTFLKATDDGGAGLSTAAATWIAVIYNIGAIDRRRWSFGTLSERFGRRRTIVSARCSALPIVPIFALLDDGGLARARARSSCRSACRARGASSRRTSPRCRPDAIRGFYPGVTYQLGNCSRPLNLPIQQALAAVARLPVRAGGDDRARCSSP